MRRRDVEQHYKQLAGWYVELAAKCGETQDGLRALRARVDNLPGAPLAPAAPWRALPPVDRQRDFLALALWVHWLINAYDLSERWPACWFRHEGLVEILRALRRWHMALSAELAGDPKAASDWHDALSRTVDRNMLAVTQRCLTAHRAPAQVAAVSADELTAALSEGGERQNVSNE